MEWKVQSVVCRVWSVGFALSSVDCSVKRDRDHFVRDFLQFLFFETLSNRLECQRVSRLPRKKRHDNLLSIIRKGNVFQLSIDTATPQENQRLEARHVDAEKPEFRTTPPPILTFSTRHQTGWNVTKCHA